MNLLLLGVKQTNYVSGDYHDDLLQAYVKNYKTHIYGPGFHHFDTRHSIDDVLKIANRFLPSIDCVVCLTTWDVDTSDTSVDPAPNLEIANLNIPTVYHLNKEYKKFDERINYIKKSNFSLILSTHPMANQWSRDHKLNIKKVHFAVNMERFNFSESKKIQFAFTGGLHKSHNDLRYLCKKQIFREKYIHKKSNLGMSNVLAKNYFSKNINTYNIYWAEWGARNWLGRSLLPTGKEYAKFLSKCQSFLNTPSAGNIFNTRYFELMASRTVILSTEVPDVPISLTDKPFYLEIDLENENLAELIKYVNSDSLEIQSMLNANYEIVRSETYDNRVLETICLL